MKFHWNEVLKNYRRELILATAFIFAYIPSFVWMWDRWFARDSYYSHGILIPFVSFFLVWNRRSALARIVPSRSTWGLGLIIGGILVHLGSSVLRVYFTSAFSMLFVLCGLILHFYGEEAFRKNFFPLLFLFFMIPLPLIVIVNVSFQMKLFAADIATRILNNIGLLAVRKGSVILMQHSYVIVDDICSGLRSLISLAALGSLFAYWLKGGAIRKTILFLSTVPIAVIANVGRVVFLAFVSEVWGTKVAAGIVHTISGFLVFALAFVFLLIVAKLIESPGTENEPFAER